MSRLGLFIPGAKRSPGTHSIAGWVGPRDRHDVSEKRKISFISCLRSALPGSEPWIVQAVSPVTIRITPFRLPSLLKFEWNNFIFS